MSKRMSAFWLPKRKCESWRATSVLPTPDGPRKTNEPTGRCGLLTPSRERRIARLIAEIERSWPITRWRRMSSIRNSRSASSLCNAATGMPVHDEMTSSMSCRVTSRMPVSSAAIDIFSRSSRSSISRSRR